MKLLAKKITPFNILEYKTKEYEREWAPLIWKVRRVANLGEVLMVEKGRRAASTYHLSKSEMGAAVESFRARGLVFTPLKWIKSFEGFSHVHVNTTENDPDAICYGVVTKDKKTGESFKKADEGNCVDHDVIGELLGYPVCCRTFFSKVWCKGYIDTIWQQAENSGGKVRREPYGGYSISIKGYPECVAMQRYWGVRISFHLPCSFRCEETKKLAQVWYDIMSEVDPDAVNGVKKMLSLPTIWDARQGVAVINTPYYKGMVSSVPCANIHTVYYEQV